MMSMGVQRYDGRPAPGGSQADGEGVGRRGAVLVESWSPHLPETAVSRVDSQQISALFSQHGPRVYRRALRLLGNPADAEEATQEIFIRAFRSAEGFRQQSQLTTWLYQITTHYCLNLIRDRTRRTQLHEEHVAPMEDGTERAEPTSPDDVLLLRRLLSEADERQAAAAVYVLLDGMSHEEAAEVLGVSKRTVGNLLERFQAWAAERVAQPPEPPPEPQKASGFFGFGRRRE